MRAGGGQSGVLGSRAGDPDSSVGLSVLPAPRGGRKLGRELPERGSRRLVSGAGIYVSDS